MKKSTWAAVRILLVVLEGCTICSCAVTGTAVSPDDCHRDGFAVPCAWMEKEGASSVRSPVKPTTSVPDADAWRSVCDEAQDMELRNCRALTQAKAAENQALAARLGLANGMVQIIRNRYQHLLGMVRADLPPRDIEAGIGEVPPRCPSEHCRMCTGEACNLCGAGCWDGAPRLGDDPDRPPCEHDVIERHQDRQRRPGGAR